MVSIGGLKPALASLVFLVAKIWDAVTDVWMGRISDNTKSRFGKRRVYMIFGAVPFGLMFIILWLCPFSVETSQFVRELDEYTYGIRREGAYYGVQSFIYKLSNGVALALVSLLLQLFQYKETPFLDEDTGEVIYSCVQSQTACDAVRIIFCVLPIAIFVISIICAFKANMGRNRFNIIKEELAKRRRYFGLQKI